MGKRDQGVKRDRDKPRDPEKEREERKRNREKPRPHVVFTPEPTVSTPPRPPRSPAPPRDRAPQRGDSDNNSRRNVIISSSRPSQGDIQIESPISPLSSPVHLYSTPEGEKVCGDGDHPDTVCVDPHGVNFEKEKDPRMWTEEDEMGTLETLLPSRTRHSTRRKNKSKPDQTEQDGEQPGPAADGDIEMHPVPSDDAPQRNKSSRRSLRNTLRNRSRKSVRRGPQDNLNIEERRTLRREDLQQMEKYEVKSLPCCTRIGYEVSLAISRSWNGFKMTLRNTKVWGNAIREIEGNLGSGVSTYFRVLRWLLMINLLNLIVGVLLITVPGLYIAHTQLNGEAPPHTYNKDDLTCTNPNFLEPNTTINNYTNTVLQFLTGSGWMESTPLYIGWYPSLNITTDEIEYKEDGCTRNDTYKCFTYNTTQYDATLAQMYKNDEKTYYDVYQCGLDCLIYEGTSQCLARCLKCGDENCKAIDNDTTYFKHNLTSKCYGVETYGSADCQFEDLFEDTNDNIYKGVGLRCDSCKRNHVTYNYSLAYVLVGLSYFVLSLLLVGRNIMKLFKKSAVELVGYTPYSQLVLGGWDYNISNRQSAILKSKSIMKSLKEELTSDIQKDNILSTKQKVALYALRLFSNLICFGAMGAVVYVFYDVYETVSTKCEDTSFIDDLGNTDITGTLTNVWKTYAPSIIVSVSNVVFPVFFEVVGTLERYQFQSTRINVTMARSFLMKLFSVISYMWILIASIKSSADVAEGFVVTNSEAVGFIQTVFTYNCWEDYVGMQLYRLVIIDFAIFCSVLFGAEYCRRFMVDRVRFVKNQFNYTEFNISKEVLDICYKQMIFWAALFFCPLISVVAFIEILLIFYLKKHSALRNVRPPEKVILNSSNSSIINFVFIVSLLVVFFHVGYIIFSFVPSENCGPFQAHKSFIDPFNVVMDKSGAFKTVVLDNLKLTSLMVCIAVMVIIIIYYFYSLAAARNLTIYLLREQIKVENADKKFLIEQMKSGSRSQSSAAVINNEAVASDKKTKKNKKAIGTYARTKVALRK